MRVWLPHIIGGSGTDTFTETLAFTLEKAGHSAVLQPFPHGSQYLPDPLKIVKSPPGIDVVLSNSWNGFAFKRPGIPMVTVEHLCVHDPAFAPFRSQGQAIFHDTLLRWFETRSFAVADCVVAVSRATRKAVAEAFPGIDATVIPNAIDTDFFTPPARRRESAEGEPFRLLFVGNLTTRKGADLLPQIMRALGSDFLLSYTSGLRGRVEIDVENALPLGKLDRQGVRRAYQEADLLLFPTRLEGLPLVVLEAMACGLPVVGSDRSSMPEAVVNETTGLLSPLDPSALATAIRTLATDSSLREAMSVAARDRVVKNFSMTHTVDQYLALFSELLD